MCTNRTACSLVISVFAGLNCSSNPVPPQASGGKVVECGSYPSSPRERVLEPGEQPVLSVRGFVPPWDLLQVGGRGSPYPQLPGADHDREWRIWWIDELAPESGMAILWVDSETGAASGQYFAWRFLRSGQSAEVYSSDVRCVSNISSHFLAACEIDVSSVVDWRSLMALVQAVDVVNPPGEPMGDPIGKFDPEELYVQVLEPGRSRVVRYERWDVDDSEHWRVRSLRDAILRLHEYAGRGRPPVPERPTEKYTDDDLDACLRSFDCWDVETDRCIAAGSGKCPVTK